MMMTSTFKINVTDIASDLSTRPVGAGARQTVIDLLRKHGNIEIDFMDRSLTPSFADECIGRLAAELGMNEFKQRVKLSNIQSSSKPLVKHVIITRCSVVAA